MFGSIAIEARERERVRCARAAAKLRRAVALERSKRHATQVANRKKRQVMDLLSAADRGAMGSLFQLWDRDGSGSIDRREFDENVTALGATNAVEITQEMLDLAWGEIDLDGSGAITYEEWLAITLRDVLAQSSSRVLDAFLQWDEDHSGTVDRNEFCNAVSRLGFDAPRCIVEEVFDEMDTDGSGSLTFDELYKQLRQGSSVKLDKQLRAGEVAMDLTRDQKNSLRGGLIAQMARHIQTGQSSAVSGHQSGPLTGSASSPPRAGGPNSSPARPLEPPAGGPNSSRGSTSADPRGSTSADPQSTSLWVCRALAQVGSRQAATLRHTAINDDATATKAAAERRLERRLKTPREAADAERHGRGRGRVREDRRELPAHLLALLETELSPQALSQAPPQAHPAQTRPPPSQPPSPPPSQQASQPPPQPPAQHAPRQPSESVARGSRSAPRGAAPPAPRGAAAPATELGAPQLVTLRIDGRSSPPQPTVPIRPQPMPAATLRSPQRSASSGSLPQRSASSGSLLSRAPSSTSSLGQSRSRGRPGSSRPHRPAPFIVRDGGSRGLSQSQSAQDLRIAALPPPKYDPHETLNVVPLTKIERLVGPSISLIMPRVDGPHRSIDNDGLACWVHLLERQPPLKAKGKKP